MGNIKVNNITENNIDRFFQVIEECKGKVEIVSEDFRLNLKSNFAKYVSLAKIFFNEEVKQIELVVEDSEDKCKLINFMLHSH